jgi:hypothetical protein|tara:strand:+ start:216 stop:407 length:192 start_codon:yes stop_codon:yes gene_type:complete
MKITKTQLEWIADEVAPMLYPTDIPLLADKLAETNPLFNRGKFIKRAYKNSESNLEKQGFYNE